MITRYIIGRGELLTHTVPPPGRKDTGKSRPYDLAEAKVQLLPQLAAANADFKALPAGACVDDQVVAKVALHPAFISKTQFPRTLLQETGLESVGSRNRTMPLRKGPVSETTELFVAGTRSAMQGLQVRASQLHDGASAFALDFCKIEALAPLAAADRVRLDPANLSEVWEVGLHFTRLSDADAVWRGFRRYAGDCGYALNEDYRFDAGQLLFVPVEGPAEGIGRLAQFTMMRVIRPMPRLRSARPVTRMTPVPIPFQMPVGSPLSTEPRVAVLDGGLPTDHVLGEHLRRYEVSDEEAETVESLAAHGLAVTSAFLYGPIQPGRHASRPFAMVDHRRILDSRTSEENRYELYRTLEHVQDVILSGVYQFLNLSLGPDLCVEDDDVHAWTAVIDDLLSSGNTLLTVAVGNNGNLDREAGHHRLQVPGDCVNALCVGAADSEDRDWNRASYSAWGPGRSPGRRKPDLLAFGGEPPEYFHVAQAGNRPHLAATFGTSFAAPLALRFAVGIRAVLGPEISPLTIKALMISACERSKKDDPHEVGWGRLPADVFDVITCPDGVARIIFQGELTAGKYLRAPIPLPNNAISGGVQVAATFCYASPVDPQDTATYTKAGLEITFRPHEDHKPVDKETGKVSANAESDKFFASSEWQTESSLRADAGKWETVLKSERTFRAPNQSLKNPHFDIHYNARNRGANTSSARNIRYALVITVHAPKHLNLYQDILDNHVKLQALEPLVSLPLRAR